jgi:nucleoside-diphosphate kinase
MIWEGKGVIAEGRKLIGATDPANSTPGSIRFSSFCLLMAEEE